MTRWVWLVSAFFLLVPPAHADQTDKRLDTLFTALELSHDISSARIIEDQIWQIWGHTDRSKSAMLYEQGTFAMANRNFSGAIEYFTELVDHDPKFAEAWNKRATVYYLVGRFEESVADIRQTLALEPRHFGALSGLGLIMMRLERPALALKSFQAAIKIHPHLPAAKSHIEMLSQRLDGERL